MFGALIALGLVGALVFARARERRAYVVAKGIASAGFVGVAVAAGATHALWSAVVLAGLVLSAIGDVVLGSGGRRAFLAGLACFLAAYAAYSVGFRLLGVGGAVWITAPVSAVIVSAAWLLMRRRLPAKMREAVAVYLAVLGVMLATGVAAGISHRMALLACGAVLVAVSDAAVAREHFGTPGFANKLLGLPAYYLGQTFIALSLAA